MTDKTMNPTEKRSCGSYGLRTVAKKKRLCEDFEYYFIKTEPPDSNIKEEEDEEEKDVSSELSKITDNAETEEGSRVDDKSCENEIDNENRVVSTYYLCTTDNLEVEAADCDGCEVLFVETLDNEEAITAVVSEKAEKLQGARESMKMAIEQAVRAHKDNARESMKKAIEQAVRANKGNTEKVHRVSYSDSTENSLVEQDEEPTDDGNVGIVAHCSERSSGIIHKYDELVHKLSDLHPDDKIECNKCHKLLKPSSFRQHLRTHSGEKPHGCKMCPSRFTRKADVDRHVRIVHEKLRPFKCFKCTRTFGDRKNLRWHLVNHDKKLFYVCHVCDFKFGKREYWENHVRYIHPQKEDTSQVLSDNSSSDCVISQDSSRLHEAVTSETNSLNDTNKTSLIPSDHTKPSIVRLNDDDEKQLSPEGIEAVVIQFDENGTVCSSEVGLVSMRNSDDGSIVHVVQSNDEESESNVFEVTVQRSEDDDEQEETINIFTGEDITETYVVSSPSTRAESEEECLDPQCV